MGKEPLIVDIKGNSLDDGPGIRSVIFFKGCPLSCVWCHNPECISPEQELLYDYQCCIGCGNCIDVCPQQAISPENRFWIDRKLCNLCMDCTQSCPGGALYPAGSKWDIAQIIEQVEKDKPFFDNSGGGVTLSGGEPALHLDYVASLGEEFKKKEIHTLIETSGLFNLKHFQEKVLPFIDDVYFDLKLVDSEKHKYYCGVVNTPILRNLKELHNLSQDGSFNLLPRMPLVPNITDTEENLLAAAHFLLENGMDRICLLPYNPLWVDKLFRMGKPNPYSEDHPFLNWMPRENEEKAKDIIRNMGITLVE